MAAHVDPAAGVVRVNGRAWPFEVDPASGEAAVQVDGRPLRLRPLSWREKRNLARFVAGGPELLERMLLRASLAMGPGSEVSAREIPAADREGLLVLSRWLSSPGDPLLPLESLLLAQVGVEVAQQLHCSPLELDGWPAWEVEATWQVVRGRSAGEGEAPAEDDGLTRILVVPDEAADSEVAGPSAGGPSPPAPLPTHPPLPPGRGGPEAGVPEVPGTSLGGGDLPRSANSEVSPLPTFRSLFRSPLPREGERARVRGIPEEPATGERRGTAADPPHPNPLPPAGGEGTGGCRRLPPQRVGTRGGGKLAPMGDLPEVPGASLCTSLGPLPEVPGTSLGTTAGGPSPPAPLPTHPPLPPGRGGPEALGHREDPDAALAALIASMPGFGDAAAWPGELPGLAAPSPLGWPEQPPPSLPPSSWPPTASGEDLEELFDLLAERLEEAAIDQGIDLEG